MTPVDRDASPPALPTGWRTERLVARLPRADDADALYDAYAADPAVSRYLMWTPHRSVDDTRAFIADCIAAVARQTRFPYVLALAERPDDPVGMLEARPSRHVVEFGYVLAPSCWGRGYMPEAVRQLTDRLLVHDRFFRVQAFCDVDNVPSQRTLDKAGFVREGRHERFVVHPNVSPEPRPCYMYARWR